MGHPLNRCHAWALAAILAALCGAAILWPAFGPLPASLRAPGSSVVEYADGTTAFVFLSPDEKWRAPADEVDPAYVRALLRLEDRRFYGHPGVDLLAAGRAVLSNVARRRRVSGASTLTLQLLRILEPRPRTLRSKLIEALRALRLERRFSKAEILRAYLERAPYGRNVEGVEAAALAYFGHRADHLTPAEIATLLAVPQSPNERFPKPSNQARLTAARNRIAARLAAAGTLPRGPRTSATSPGALLAEVERTAVPSRLRPFPREAPHVAAWLHALHPGEERLRTTLDRGAQTACERLFLRARSELALQGVHNGALVVVDHATARVVAALGSFDFWDSSAGGELVGFDLPRSPGSTLKPFLYAMAIDEGIAGPATAAEDIPGTFGTYAPSNFDGRYAGLVPLQEALSRSLNLPFVRLLKQVGVERFVGTLRELGARSLKAQPGAYGLSAIVGGVELKPAEVAALYAALAEGGRYRPLRWLADEPLAQARPAFSPGAAYLTRRALLLKDRPDFPSRRELSQSPANIHWKTGTSFGHRDAWAAGSSASLTAVVWLGNFDDSPSSALVGAEAAGPILFDVLEALSDRSRPAALERPPPDLVPVEVCALSGRRANASCPRRKTVLARRDAVPTAPCPYHVALEVDAHTHQALGPLCRTGRSFHREVFTVLPAAVRRWMGDQLRGLAEPPAFAPGCSPAAPVPQILSPVPGQVSILVDGVPLERQQVPLEAEVEGASAPLSWFVDGQLLGTARPDERLWWKPELGRHEVVVTTESGTAAHRILVVRRAL